VLKNLTRDLQTMVWPDRRSSAGVGDQAGARRVARGGKASAATCFSGPTGVGKTEVARQLARTMA